MKKVTVYTGLVLFYLLLFTVAAEGWVRLFRLAPPAAAPGFFWHAPDPQTGWALEPNAEGRWFNPMYEYDVPVTINALGLRSPAIDYVKAPGVYRVLTLGDSYVEGLQTPLAETFPQQLAQELTQHLDANVKVEVISAGVSGWGTDQQLLWLRAEGASYQPDLVLLAFYPGNDFMNNYMPLEFSNFGSVRKPWFALDKGVLQLHDFPFDPAQARDTARRLRREQARPANTTTDEAAVRPLQPVGHWLKGRSALYRYLDPRLRVVMPRAARRLVRWGLLEAGQESSDATHGPAHIPVTYGVYHQPPSAEWEAAFTLTGRLLTALRDEVQDIGAKMGAVLLTAPEQVDPERWPRTLAQYPAMQQETWALDGPTQRALALLAAAKIPTLDLLPLFRQATADGVQLHLADDGHWTRTGHQLAGMATAQFVVEQNWLPLSSPLPPLTWRHTRAVREWLLWIIVGLLGVSLLWSVYKNGPVIWLRQMGVALGTVYELVYYMVQRRQFILLPVLLILLLFGGLLVIAQASVVGPFIYTLF
ncbi:MAG: SGNH/GDSL hydrolase family protein [Caldilineaceae bacterium]